MIFRYMSFIKQILSKNNYSRKMQLNVDTEYREAVTKLNNLQSNAQYIKQFGTKTADNQHIINSAEITKKYLERSGLSLEKLDNLSVIHVTGTKGKGSTCAFAESILRHHGYKTGFFSSPHLLEVRERIRIDGIPIEKNEFVSCFWKVYNELDLKKENENDMPLYFGFLTVMAFNYFVQKNVDVAIIEVGIGGEYDCTNALRKVPVAGITSIGIDHTILLGNTIESIAWNKSGIMKEGTKVFTVPQCDAAMNVLKERSISRKSILTIVNGKQQLPLKNNCFPSDIMNLNTSLALALSKAWIDTVNNNGHKFSLDLAQIGLENCIWPGRYEIRKENNVTYYLDGAHTVDSISVCVKWFEEKTNNSNNKKVLMFNLTGDRDAEIILKELSKLHFDTVFFVPNQSGSVQKLDIPLDKCRQNMKIWQNLNEYNQEILVMPSILNAVNYLNDKQEQFELLITGSLYLIGAALELLDPNLKGTL